MKISLSTRTLFLLGLLSCTSAIAIALYFQLVQGLNPCALCVFQRVAIIATGVVFLIAAIHRPNRIGTTVYAVIALLLLGIGLSVALRQVWLQQLPANQIPECGPGLNYLLQVLPLNQVITIVLKGSGDCAKVDWRFLGLSMAGWSAVWFVGMLVMTAWILVKHPRKSHQVHATPLKE